MQVTPILEARLRGERAEQHVLDADAVTLRLRIGLEAKRGPWSLLAEAEGTAAPGEDYNPFPFPLTANSQSRPAYLVISDPENGELNRLQIQYKNDRAALTLGRQRIELDDQRWVGSVGWRQNEQTFDALRGTARVGQLTADATHAVSQRTIFGSEAGPRTAIDGDFVFLGLSSKLGQIEGKLFAYLLGYDEGFSLANSSQTWGFTASATVPVGRRTKVALKSSLARQSDYAENPFDYAAHYWSFDARTTLTDFSIVAGFEMLGSDKGRSVQTPMATLHKFNGWADLFLTTPPNGLKDFHVSASRNFNKVRVLPGLNASIAFHHFRSAARHINYGSEWDASIGFRIGRTALLAKFADYDARDFGVDTRKFWLQAEWALPR